MNAAEALADLTEISAQIEGAVLVATDGGLAASTFAEGARAEAFATAALAFLQAADETGAEDDEALVQLEGATADGSVFVVRGERHVAAAVTRPNPTVGLVLYDLKTCLRLLEREDDASAAGGGSPGASGDA